MKKVKVEHRIKVNDAVFKSKKDLKGLKIKHLIIFKIFENDKCFML